MEFVSPCSVFLKGRRFKDFPCTSTVWIGWEFSGRAMRWRAYVHLAHAMRAGARPGGLLFATVCLWVAFAGAALAQVCGIPPCGGGGGGTKPLSVILLQDLDYALVGSTNASGTVTIDSATGTKTVAGGVLDFGGIHSRAYFEIHGEKNRSFTITLPASVTITSAGGATTTITGFESTPAFTGTLAGNGKAFVYVGAVLQVGASQLDGIYNNLFDITVNYTP